MVKIANASIDENGKIYGGVAGDQTGREVVVRDWYNRPWDCVIRFRNADTANKIASFMEKACANNNIGYDQWQRNSLHTELKKVNFAVEKITTPCETDCSALVSDACIAAGVPESFLYIGGNLSVTSNLRQRLDSTGLVTVFRTTAYTKSTDKLQRGDILLNEGSHVAVVVSGATTPTPVVTEKFVDLKIRMLKKGMKGADVKALQLLLNGKNNARLDPDGDFGSLTATEVSKYQKSKNLEVDSIVGKDTWTSLLTN